MHTAVLYSLYKMSGISDVTLCLSLFSVKQAITGHMYVHVFPLYPSCIRLKRLTFITLYYLYPTLETYSTVLISPLYPKLYLAPEAYLNLYHFLSVSGPETYSTVYSTVQYLYLHSILSCIRPQRPT
jgi:hypothetical protein